MAIINATLVVQGINFAIAFYLIKYFFYKPVIQQILANQTLHDTLIKDVQENQSKVAQYEQQLIDNWKLVRQNFAQNQPSQTHEIFLPERISITTPQFDPAEIKKQASLLSDILVKEVSRVR